MTESVEAQPELKEISGTLERVKFENDDGNWSVAELRLDGDSWAVLANPIAIVVGDLLGSNPGEQLVLRGHWKHHASFGRQFEIKSIKTAMPVSERGITIYLSSKAVDGIGGVLAKRLVKHFGPDTLDIIANDPKRLLEVSGIGKGRVKRIAEAWQQQCEVREVMLFLNSLNISTAYANRIYRVYGTGCMTRVQRDPYSLARDVHGIGFILADRIATELGIVGDDPRRVRAGIQYVLREAQTEGHLYLPLTELERRAYAILAVDVDHIKNQVEILRTSGQVMLEPVTDDDDDDGEGHLAVYPRIHWNAELECGRNIRRLLEGSVKNDLLEGTIKIEPILESVERTLDIKLAPGQKKAIASVITNHLMVITGGPGTGKTTIVRAICSVADAHGWRCILAAPTGRAARRMSEATGRAASTLHRTLKFSFQEGGFQQNADNPLSADIVIVDEASMIDIHLMRGLLVAVASGCRLVMVGDVDQLPSVGPGDVLAELISSSKVPVSRLNSVFRQAEQSAIVRNAHRVNQGLYPENTNARSGDFFLITAADADDVLRKTLHVVTERISAAFGYDPRTDVQVIAPMHKGTVGCVRLNQELQEAINPKKTHELKRGTRIYRPGDRVMQLRNDYEKEVFNGDIGHVVSITTDGDDSHSLLVDMEGREVLYEPDDLDNLNLAYAITAHKSQGSEYKVVVIALATAHYVLLERNLLYTALTRARELAVVVTMDAALGRAVKTVSARTRFTRLAARI